MLQTECGPKISKSFTPRERDSVSDKEILSQRGGILSPIEEDSPTHPARQEATGEDLFLKHTFVYSQHVVFH